MANGTRDVLAQLLQATWRRIPFPTVLVSSKGSHRITKHARMDRDGERVENTGRNGYVFTARIPCINTLARGPHETWAGGDLYPTTYRLLIAALEDRSTGDLNHPDFGKRKCKVAEWESTLDPDFRGGPTLNVTWCETVDDADGDAVKLASSATFSVATQAAIDLDRFLYERPGNDTGTPRGQSLTDFLKSIGSLADEWELFKAQWSAAFDRIGYSMGKLAEKFGAEDGFSDNTERLISALHALRYQALANAKSTSTYIVPRATTLPTIAIRVRNTVPDLLKLNPALAARPIVPAETPVRYYG